MRSFEEYRRPFVTPGEDRLPTSMWLRQVPICGEPAEAVEVVAAYAAWLAGNAGAAQAVHQRRA
jgi:haloalkane dehalogenase